LIEESKNPYGDGIASRKIIEIIKNEDLRNILKKSFYDLKV
jgi:GDP/UDP-N,N'-diacetylbacillosamine 2-epimerase (hydrolysing)